jgi:WD40 repeat protein
MNADKGEIVTRFDCPVQSADFSACDNLIAVGAQDGTVKIINVADTNQVRRIKDHEGQVKGIAFDPQRQFLATAGADGRVNIYDYLNGDVKVASMTLVPAVPVGYEDGALIRPFTASPCLISEYHRSKLLLRLILINFIMICDRKSVERERVLRWNGVQAVNIWQFPY